MKIVFYMTTILEHGGGLEKYFIETAKELSEFPNIKVDVVTLDYLLESLNIDHIDFLSLDVERWELEILKGFDTEKFQPYIIMVENIGHNPEYKKYMNSKNYTLIISLAIDEIYKRL